MTWPHHIYLGSVTPDEGSKHEILEGSEPNNWAQSYPMRAPNLRYFRTAQTTAAMTRLKPVWNDRNISVSSKIRLMRSLITSIFLYAFESWTLTAKLKKIPAMERRCYRKILRISCNFTNEEVRAKIQQAIGPHEDLLTIVKRRKLRWYSHVSCS